MTAVAEFGFAGFLALLLLCAWAQERHARRDTEKQLRSLHLISSMTPYHVEPFDPETLLGRQDAA